MLKMGASLQIQAKVIQLNNHALQQLKELKQIVSRLQLQSHNCRIASLYVILVNTENNALAITL